MSASPGQTFTSPNTFSDSSDSDYVHLSPVSGHTSQHPTPPEHREKAADSVHVRRRAIDQTTDNSARQSDSQSLSVSRNLDLATLISGFYRILDLIQEKASDGLVDKIIIEQESLGKFINDLHLGAYTSITKVDFRALDTLDVKPVGVYGSKTSIVEFLRQKGAVDDNVSTALLEPHRNDRDHPTLRSGIYLFRHQSGSRALDEMFVIYWPEDSTWDDQAASSRQNRVMFMRYLTKLSDQVVCLMADELAKTIVRRRNYEDNDSDGLDDVSKTNEQDKGVTFKIGFEIAVPPSPTGTTITPPEFDATALRPRLVRGECSQGLLTAEYVGCQQMSVDEVDKSINEVRLKELLKRNSIRLDEDLNSNALQILLRLGMKHGCKDAVADFQKAAKRVQDSAKEKESHELDEMLVQVKNDEPDVYDAVAGLLTRVMTSKFSLVGTVQFLGSLRDAPAQRSLDRSPIPQSLLSPTELALTLCVVRYSNLVAIVPD
ncbi:uncharacterized protein BXZ73DRAFT_107365 [Epithele typhae]|uniref:uncharacterized protein n=1 Tax=Epithele typhae TaxID=378194 RepID=UPI0020084479|nr:uncharacterized protein BXZ73DRAFT_107365 [Epithele typhae]KAH9912635.1 hypothetical protein BXZ73DRAFT_107365 [Epithele typhae]